MGGRNGWEGSEVEYRKVPEAIKGDSGVPFGSSRVSLVLTPEWPSWLGPLKNRFTVKYVPTVFSYHSVL